MNTTRRKQKRERPRTEKGIVRLLQPSFDEVKQQVQEVRRHIGVVAEDFQSKLSLVSETLTGRMDILEGGMKEMRVDITELRSDVTEMRGDITGLRSDVVEMRGDITGLRSDVVEIRGDITEIRGDVSGIRNTLGRKVDYEEFSGLERRVSFLETKKRD